MLGTQEPTWGKDRGLPVPSCLYTTTSSSCGLASSFEIQLSNVSGLTCLLVAGTRSVRSLKRGLEPPNSRQQPREVARSQGTSSSKRSFLLSRATRSEWIPRNRGVLLKNPYLVLCCLLPRAVQPIYLGEGGDPVPVVGDDHLMDAEEMRVLLSAGLLCWAKALSAMAEVRCVASLKCLKNRVRSRSPVISAHELMEAQCESFSFISLSTGKERIKVQRLLLVLQERRGHNPAPTLIFPQQPGDLLKFNHKPTC